MKSTKVCIIEDDVVFRICCKTLMREREFSNNFIEFDNGHNALAWLVLLDDSSPDIPDVILLDIKMPEMDGWSFLSALEYIKKSVLSKIAIYLLTSSVDDVDKKKAFQNPMVKGYFSKPFQDEHIEIMQETAVNIDLS